MAKESIDNKINQENKDRLEGVCLNCELTIIKGAEFDKEREGKYTPLEDKYCDCCGHQLYHRN